MAKDLKKSTQATTPATPAKGGSSRTAGSAPGKGFQAMATPLKNLYDPIRKVCYEPLAAHYEERYRKKFPVHHSKIFFLDMTLLFVIGALVVAWIFMKTLLPLIPAPPLAQLDYGGPQTVTSGKDEEYTYTYQNLSAQDLVCSELRVHLPPGTVLSDNVPVIASKTDPCIADLSGATGHLLMDNPNDEVLVFPVGMIRPNGRGTVHFKARMYAPTNDVLSLDADFTYWERAATTASSVSAREDLPVAASTLNLGISMPKTVGRGLPHSVTIAYENAGDRTLSGTTVRMIVPGDFVVTGTTPAMETSGEWRLGDVVPGAKGQLTVFGYFRTSPDQLTAAQTFSARAYVRDGGFAQFIENVEKNADARAADLVFTQNIISPAGRQALSPGDTVHVTITYKNAGPNALNDMEIRFDPGASFISNASPAGLGWDGTTLPALRSVAPGESGTLEATFTVNDVISAGDFGTDAAPTLHMVSHATYSPENAAGQIVRVDTSTTSLPVTTALGIQAAAMYYTKDGDQLGVGPLPPKVGATTTYRVFLTVTTTSGAVDGARVEAALPANVTWSDHESVNEGTALTYFPTTRRVRWDIAHLPANSGSGDASRIGASFEVEITPTKKEIGSAPQLLTDIKVNGVDTATGATVHAAAAALSTDLPYDRRAAGKGTVVK